MDWIPASVEIMSFACPNDKVGSKIKSELEKVKAVEWAMVGMTANSHMISTVIIVYRTE